MGYETRLLIGRITNLTDDEIVEGDLIVEKGDAYRPYLKDEDGNYLKTGKKETWFQIYTDMNLCSCGHESKLHDLDRVNKDESHHYYWYDGDDKKTEDKYGCELRPVPIADVIEAIKADMETEDYRRFRWALALLESMVDDKEDIHVLLYGH